MFFAHSAEAYVDGVIAVGGGRFLIKVTPEA
jgi:hypothetical protein